MKGNFTCAVFKKSYYILFTNTSPLTDLQGLPPKFFNMMLPKVSLPSLRSLFSKQEYWRPCEIGGQYALFDRHYPVAFCYLNFAAVFVCTESVKLFCYDLSFCWRFIHCQYQTWMLTLKIFNLQPNRFLSASIAILRIYILNLVGRLWKI